PHDAFRGFRGSFQRTLDGIASAAAAGLPLQVNTTVCALNVDGLPQLVPQLERWGIVQWSVFFLVPTGRGSGYADGLDRPARGSNEGRGFMFISHRGDVMPSGFLPLAAGNVRSRN